jgi:hypothetical protein
MKKLLLLSFLALGLLSISPNSFAKAINYSTVKKNAPVECQYSQCQAIAKSTGNQCKHCVSNSGDSFCWQHKK